MPAKKTPLLRSRSRDEIRRLAHNYADNQLFINPGDFIVQSNPYRRPIRPQDLDGFDFSRQLPRDQFLSASALAAQRILLNVYESELIFLPKGPLAPVEQDFRTFYADELKLAGEAIRPILEDHLFGFLDREIDVSGPWSLPAMRAYFAARLAEANRGESRVVETILAAGDKEAAATDFLIQLAADFLTEASAMARNVLGNFGGPLSELFKVLIDEYGYGVPEAKHSALFEKTLESRELLTDIHAYWQFYLGSSLALVNYFHLVSRNHANFFRYLGALYYTESTLSHANRQQAHMLQRIFPGAVDTRYFEEHVHIDQHHSRMVLSKIIEPIVERCGDAVILEIVRGFEEFRLLQELADEDLIAQIEWSNAREEFHARAQRLVAQGGLLPPAQRTAFKETKGELSVTHVHDEHELFLVEDGAIDLLTGYDQSVRLAAGDAMVIARNRLHGSVVLSETCRYSVQPVEDAQLWSC